MAAKYWPLSPPLQDVLQSPKSLFGSPTITAKIINIAATTTISAAVHAAQPGTRNMGSREYQLTFG
jgi:hypothetical protein